MDLAINNQQFVVCGASSGFGRAIAEQLLREDAAVIAVARRKEKLTALKKEFGQSVTPVSGDLLDETTHQKIEQAIDDDQLQGLVLNAGGPPTGTPLETTMKEWDESYEKVMRWKIALTQRLIPYFTKNNYGRILFIESQSVKQPLPALALSNAFRAGIVGFAKSLALEVADQQITVNVLAPGSHNTPAIERVINNKVDETGESYEKTKAAMEASIPVGRFGEGKEIASLAAWLLSPQASYVTGQTISHDGGNIKGLFG